MTKEALKQARRMGKQGLTEAFLEALAQPEQEPDWKEEYQKAVDLHCITLDELREANIEIKRLIGVVGGMALAQPVQRQPLTDEQHEKLWEAIRATGYLTKGQVDEVMEVVESHIGAK